MKRHTEHDEDPTTATASPGAGKRVMRRVALGLAALGVCCVVGGCDSWMDEGAGVKTAAGQAGSGQKSTYIERRVGTTYEGILLKPNGTYQRTIVDGWGHGHQHEGTWRGYGGSVQNGKGQVSRRLELDSYTDTSDIINSNSAKPTPKTKTLSSGDFYMK